MDKKIFEVLDPWLDLPVKKDLPQCDTSITKGQKVGTRCRNRSSVIVEGKNYCRLHAGNVLLDMVAGGAYKVIKKVGDG